MRVLLSLTYYLPHVSGITVYNHRLARALVAAGHDVTVITSRFDGALPRSEMMDGVRVERIPVWFWISKGAIMPGFVRRFARLCARHDVVLMNLPNTPVEAFCAPVIARLMGRPLIVKHMCDIELPPSPFNRVVNAVSRWSNLFAAFMSDRVVTMTDDYARYSPVLRHFRRKLAVISPPVEMCKAEAADVEKWKAAHGVSGRPLIGFAARLSTEKGVEVLLTALPRILRRVPEAIVLFAGERENVIGEASYRRTLEPLLEASRGNWVFLGLVPQKELPLFYTACDVTVLPSLNRTESFGIVQVESMMCGTPVVASDLPGVRDAIRRTGMGRVVPTGSPRELANAVSDVIQNRERYTRPVEDIKRRYSTQKTRRHYEQLFDESARARNIAWEHLSHKPKFLALQRAVEHWQWRAIEPPKEPMLDIGIGDGHFGAAVFGGKQLVGIDVGCRSLREASQRFRNERGYTALLGASADRLPFAPDSFASVVANSTLEHIVPLRESLREIHRVLKPGGMIAFTVPNDQWNANLFTASALDAIGLKRLANRYRNWFRRIQRHHHMLAEEEWRRELEVAGFTSISVRPYFSPKSTGWLEVLHYEGWHNLLAKRLLGRWVWFPWRPLHAPWEWFVTAALSDRSTIRDSCFFIIAHKGEAR